jgi:hypothetical protein
MDDNHQNPSWIRLKNFCRIYSREVIETSIRTILLLISTVVLSLVVLYFYSLLWHLFRMTYSGNRFIALHPEANNAISNIVNDDLIEMSIHTTFSAFTICMVICAICRLSYITRYLYDPRNTIAKLVFWGLPLTIVVSMYINDQFNFAHWAYTLPLTIVPTLCVFTYCFKFSETLLPEFGDVVLKIFQALKAFFSLQPHRQN